MNVRLTILTILFLMSAFKSNAVEILWQNQVHKAQINKILLNQSEDIIISCSSDSTIIFTNTKSGERINKFDFDKNVFDISLMSDEKYLLVSSKHRKNSIVTLFNTETNTNEITLDLKAVLDTNKLVQNQEFIEVHSIQVDENRILTGIGVYSYIEANHYYKGRLDLWNIKTSSWIKEVFNGGMINNLVISDDAGQIAFSTLQNSSEFIDFGEYKESEETKLYLTDTSFKEFTLLREDYDENMEFADTEIINDITFSNNSKYFAVATDDHHLFVYDVENRILKDSIYSCSCYADQSIGFIYDCEHLISGTSNGKVNFWNIEFALGRDSHTYDNNAVISSIAASKIKNIYAIADIKGNISLVTSWEISDVSEQIKIEKPEYTIVYDNSNLEMELLNDYKNIKISIFDLLGNSMGAIKTVNSNDKIIINVEQFTPGIYIIRAIIDGITITEKFQKSF